MVSCITLDGPLLEGRFQERPNRFLGLVEVRGKLRSSFLPNPGRLLDLLTPGVKVVLREVLKEGRKTRYDLIGVFHNGQVVSVDTRVPNKLAFEGLRNGDLGELAGYDTIQPEWSYGDSRFDFLLANHRETCLLEVKSCTLVHDGVALFPDAPTERGRRHVRTLVAAKQEGYRACVLFIVQRTGAHMFTPHDEMDPAFGAALRHAVREGVEVYAYASEFSGRSITLHGKVKGALNRMPST